jgi:hypothetical protein
MREALMRQRLIAAPESRKLSRNRPEQAHRHVLAKSQTERVEGRQ